MHTSFIAIFIFVAVHGLPSPGVENRGYSLVAVPRLFTVVASLVTEHGLLVCKLQQLWLTALVVLWHVDTVSCIGGWNLYH